MKEKNTHIHALSFLHSNSLKKQHPNLKCNNTNNASLSLSLSSLKNVIPTTATKAKNPNPIQKPQSKAQYLPPFQPT